MKSIRYPIENVSIFESIFCAFVQAVEYMGRRHGNRPSFGGILSIKEKCVRQVFATVALKRKRNRLRFYIPPVYY